MNKKQAYNPYLPSYEYIPDGEPRVFNNRLYIHGSHDRFGSTAFCLNDYVSHGLSYTKFEYQNMKLNAKDTLPSENLKVSIDIKNIGNYPGSETVQLYLKDIYASKIRPVLELAEFAKVYLQKGEKKTIEFEINPSQIAFIDDDEKWKIEKGEIEILIDSSSFDIRETTSFNIIEDAWIKGRDRKFIL